MRGRRKGEREREREGGEGRRIIRGDKWIKLVVQIVLPRYFQTKYVSFG